MDFECDVPQAQIELLNEKVSTGEFRLFTKCCTKL